MTYSVIRVEGLSMKPFLITDDHVFVENVPISSNLLKMGACLHLSKNVHRLVSIRQTKGDRLIYFDQFDLNSLPINLVLGRVLMKGKKMVISNYQHPVLMLISKTISLFSKK